MKWIAALLVGLALAGCTGSDDDGKSDEKPIVEMCKPGEIDDDGVNLAPTDFNITALLDADAWDFESTNYRTCTVEKIGHTPLRWTPDGEPAPHKYLGEIDMRGDLDLGVVAALGSSETPTVYLLDITNRADPVVLSSITQTNTYIVDVKISDDGDFLFTASQTIPTVGETPDPDDPSVPRPPVEPLAPTAPNGFSIYDISDRSAPTFLQTIESPDDIGCHMISHEIIDDTDVVFCVGQHIRAHGLVRSDAGPWVYLGSFDYRLPDGSATTGASPAGCINDIILVGNAAGALCSGPHDMTVQVDPVDGKTYMTVSHWNEGLRVVDVSAPLGEGFVTVASWAGEGAKHYDGNVHTAMMFWIGETRYVVATPEMTYGGVVPAVWVLDATSLDGQLELVAEWYHPRETPTPGLFMTTHQWQVAPTGPEAAVEDVNVYITMNHAGLWVLDFAAILGGDLQGAIGGFHMSRAPLNQTTAVGNAILSTWDVNVVDGYIYGSDRATGLWVFDYTDDAHADPRLTGFA